VTAATKLQTKTAAERRALAEELDALRASLALLAADINPSMGGHDVGDEGYSLARARRACARLTDILEGRLEVKS